ncbi:DUF4349 domain-containing protein [Patescibacteria group bacterium]|nr:DUF4349 domain-containing protein [Patescibacteria group bacterium]MCL5091580.1 DUF4349 domain-containing protein [Patescibacteria group bacterium]
MTAVWQWIKSNKIISVLLVIVIFLLFKKSAPVSPVSFSAFDQGLTLSKSAASGGMAAESVAPPTAVNRTTPADSSQGRMTIANSYLSLLVKNVEAAQRLVVKKTQELGGFMVYSSLNNPTENTNANITVRLPSQKLDQALTYFKSLSIKVVAENLTGEDVTDQYSNIQARLDTLNKTKTVFEAMLDKATTVTDILNVQREILNLQDQIDAQIGQKKYLEQNATMSKITVYLSTDELSLPYAPLESWRPQLILKEAVRSLIANLRWLAGSLIWLGVYSVIWLPALLIFLLVKKRFIKRAS